MKHTKRTRKSAAAHRAPKVVDRKERVRFSVKKVKPTIKDFIHPWRKPRRFEDKGGPFNVKLCWKLLMKLPSCVKLMIVDKQQKALGLQVGIHVSQEFPWRHVTFDLMRKHLNVAASRKLRPLFRGCKPEQTFLFGYVPILTQHMENPPEGDPFIVFASQQDARTALQVIRNLETYERWRFKRHMLKKPRKWKSVQSEREIVPYIRRSRHKDVDLEIQSVFPVTITESDALTLRQCDDARDGYVELLPAETEKFDHVYRRRVSTGIQSAAQRVSKGQQTILTFPSNAAAQHVYELLEGGVTLDESSEEEENEQQNVAKGATAAPAQPKPPIEFSESVTLLLEMLSYNPVDMYRDDYPLITDSDFQHYISPFLEEALCYVDISKSYGRYVTCTDWHPTVSGLIVVSYAFDTQTTVELVTDIEDQVQRAVLDPNPVLMWSFADNLSFKIEFECPMEANVIAFAPFNAHLLIGGFKSGQIIIWDLLERVERLDAPEVRTSAQIHYCKVMEEFLSWTLPLNEESSVPPAYVSPLELSQQGAITGIYWLGRKFFINNIGKIYKDTRKEAVHKCFITSSMDGSVSFWNLDAAITKKVQGYNRDQPKELTAHESPFKNKILKPVYTLLYDEPITAVVADTSIFSCKARQPLKERKNKTNFPLELISIDRPNMRASVITSSFYGRLERLSWTGAYVDPQGREEASGVTDFARIHDGPVLAMKKSPFMPSVFISIGRFVFAIWKDNFHHSPLLWRRRPSDLTGVAWSEARPGVFYLTRNDGCLEAWDILSRDDDACLSEVLGGGMMTALSEYRLIEPEKLLGIADYNSSFRMIRLPPSFYEPTERELGRFRTYIRRAELRKQSILDWEQWYYERNRDVIDAKNQAEIDALLEIERLEKEAALNEARKVQEELDAARKANLRQHPTYGERMRQKWDTMNVNRLLAIMMTRNRVDPVKLHEETLMEKRRRKYLISKRRAIHRSLQRTANKVAAVRARILPAEAPVICRHDLIVMIVNSVVPPSTLEYFKEVGQEAAQAVKRFQRVGGIEYVPYLLRGIERRGLIEKSRGANTERRHWYEQRKGEKVLREFDWNYLQYLNETPELRRQTAGLAATENPAPPAAASEGDGAKEGRASVAASEGGVAKEGKEPVVVREAAGGEQQKTQ